MSLSDEFQKIKDSLESFVDAHRQAISEVEQTVETAAKDVESVPGLPPEVHVLLAGLADLAESAANIIAKYAPAGSPAAGADTGSNATDAGTTAPDAGSVASSSAESEPAKTSL